MSSSPHVTLMIATGCQHCPSVLQSLSELIKAGTIGSLEVINIQQYPERAQQLNVRSVPWVKIGDFELVGLRSLGELKTWAERVNDPAIMADYFEELMTTGEINKVQQLVQDNPDYFSALLQLMVGDETSLSARIGVGALMEEFAGSDLLKQNIDALGEYTRNANPRIRNDACHYLGMSDDPRAETYVRPLLDDEDKDVREVAAEALDTLAGA